MTASTILTSCRTTSDMTALSIVMDDFENGGLMEDSLGLSGLAVSTIIIMQDNLGNEGLLEDCLDH